MEKCIGTEVNNGDHNSGYIVIEQCGYRAKYATTGTTKCLPILVTDPEASLQLSEKILDDPLHLFRVRLEHRMIGVRNPYHRVRRIPFWNASA